MLKQYLPGLALSLLTLSGPLHADSGASGREIEFLSPSRNIYCTSWQNRAAVSCLAVQHSQAASGRPASCDLDWTPTVELGGRGAAKRSGLCHGDLPYNPDAGVLAYGQTVQGRDWRCLVAENGVRCENASGRGFHLNRTSRQLF
ncbi:DUF6636 domain-containing protein [Neisseria shayeganii]|uniref:Uncharacterized protein n=1 Tax=Neisseria shayeganii 871 TaxID=1032488 RepID=G4CF36_9NEIS|nr:DUF6636 domain-containing protein [Neisseria shayeganii]EGY53574.1 hypothetical protein HMPREF9371_0225 [Neisseria shayeganii 871]